MTSTRERMTKLLFAWTAVTALILTTACTPKRGSPPPEGVIKKPGPTATPQPETSTNANNGKRPPVAGSELDKDSSANSQVSPEESLSSEDGAPQAAGEKPTAVKDGGFEEVPAGATADGEVVTDPTGMTPDQIFAASDALGSADGGLAADVEGEPRLYYSGAGQDLLREQLMTTVGAKASADDRSFARKIGISTFDIDWNSRRAKATVTVVGKDGTRESFDFSGRLDSSSKLKAGSLSGTPGLLLEAACMDLDGGCLTVHMRIKRKAKDGGIRTAHVIARQTNAHLFTEGNQPGVSQNHEYDRLMTNLLNTVNYGSVPESVRSMKYITSETINGRSEFAIVMKLGSTAEQLALTGPLVKPQGSTEMNLVLDPPLSKRGAIAGSIRETHLIRNDGRGNLQFDIVIRKGSASASEDTIRLTVARKHPQGVRSPILK